jgi:hypothetical protein
VAAAGTRARRRCGSALLRFHGSVQGPDWTTFLDAIKPLKDGNGTTICRNAMHKAGGCPLAMCPGWHPQHGSREAKQVLDAVQAAMPAFTFDVL